MQKEENLEGAVHQGTLGFSTASPKITDDIAKWRIWGCHSFDTVLRKGQKGTGPLCILTSCVNHCLWKRRAGNLGMAVKVTKEECKLLFCLFL